MLDFLRLYFTLLVTSTGYSVVLFLALMSALMSAGVAVVLVVLVVLVLLVVLVVVVVITAPRLREKAPAVGEVHTELRRSSLHRSKACRREDQRRMRCRAVPCRGGAHVASSL